jgi:hypothetical protein
MTGTLPIELRKGSIISVSHIGPQCVPHKNVALLEEARMTTTAKLAIALPVLLAVALILKLSISSSSDVERIPAEGECMVDQRP